MENPADDNVTQWVFGLNGQTVIPVEGGTNTKSSPKRKKRDKSPPKEPRRENTAPATDLNPGTLVMAYTSEKTVTRTAEPEPDPPSRTRVTATELDLADFQPQSFSYPPEDACDVYDGPKKSAVGHQARPSFIKSSWGKEVLAEYVTRNILQAECNYYVKNPSSRGASCKCGRTFEWHRQRGCVYSENNEAEQWNPRNYTEKLPCDSFGEICFQGFGNETKNSPYVRLDCATDLDNVWTVLTECWCLPYPTLIISVIGCSGRLDLKPRLKSVFKQGLVNAVASTGAWLITDGTHTGVEQLVGQAVQDYHLTAGASERADIVALGIADWGTVTNKDALEGDLDNGMFPAYYSIEAVTDSRRTAPLDHNHTHFLLVDDGTEKRPGHATDFRVSLESYISGRVETGIAEDHSVSVPAVLLIVGGDRDALTTVLAYVRRRTPVVVIQGTGRTADILATAYKLSRNPQNDDSSAYPPGFLATCMRNIQAEFHWPETDDMAVFREAKESMRLIMEILQHRQMLSVFQLDDAGAADIDKCILYALLKANKHRPETQLALTLAWNRSDVAREKIFTYENRKKWQKVNLYDAMFTALVQDRVEFIQLFIDSGVDLKRLTVSTLWNLYAHVMNEPPDNCAELLKGLVSFYQETSVCCGQGEKGETTEDLLKKIGRLLRDLLGEQFMNLYKGPRFLLSKAMSSQPWGQEQSPYEQGSKNSPWDKKKKWRMRQDFENPERELFIWSLLLNRREMAKFFWRLGKDHIGGAMVACTLLKSLSAMAEDEEEADLSESLLEHASYYENVAEAVLSETYKRNKRMAHALLVRELSTWGDTTLFVLAQNGELMEVMDHACCQTKLNLIWNGCIAQHTPVWKVIMTILCPVLIPMIKFADNETLKEVTDENLHVEEEDLRPPPLNRVTPEGLSDVHFTQSRTRITKPRKRKRSFFQVNCCAEDSGFSGVNINFCNAIFYFYTAPVTKFYCNVIAYMIFLCLFTYFVLTDLRPMTDVKSVSVSEWVTWGWAFTMFIEEFRQIFARTPKVMKYKLISWGRSFWNRYDMTMYLLFILSIVLRCTLIGEDFVWARMVYSITLTMFYLRLMQTFYAEKNIGPKVIMIKLMLTDLVFFLLILFVFVVSFGTAYHANLYPNTRLSWDILKNVIYIPYWQTYGLFNLDVIEGNLEAGSCLGNSSVVGLDTCPEQTWLVPVLTAIYVLLTHILLVNLLIAMFSYTFAQVQKNSEKVWSYYRFSIIFEYYDRPAFVAPLSLLVYVYRLFRYCCYGGMRQSTAFRRLLKQDDYERYTSLERSSTEKILTRAIIEQREGLDSKVTSAADRLDRVMAELENIKEQIEEPKDAGDLVHADTDNDRSRASGRESSDLVNFRLNEMQQQLTTVLSLLTQHSQPKT